ncbi:Do family serine endopeptidase [Gilvimarinus sp. F26214L]|uniref:Do family serine endopeptidase n=1 Tax=Gilvimarinus sp. DZF01 TaxID=3461371 RepID=UPI004046780D
MTFKRLLITLVAVVMVPVTTTVHSAELPEFTKLIEEVSPAVVKITTQATVGGSQGMPIPPGEEVPELFRRFFDPREMPERNIGGMGSGFIISEDGYVLTNNHVVANANEILVRLGDRREFEAEVIGSDERSDLALLKIDADDLPYLEFASDGDIEVGEWVLAIGSPFGLDFSASQGIVSAVGRDIPSGGGGSYVPFIQTDVAINPGNSGGPLFNLDGKVVGINSQIYTRSGGYMGLSFAIPANVAQSVVRQLQNKGRVERGYLGVQIRDLSRDEARAFGLSRPEGALVLDVMKDGPAHEGGMQPGDVVLEFNGEDIADAGDLPLIVGDTEPGEKARVVVMRERKKRTLDVTVGTLDEEEEIAAETTPGSSSGQADKLGVVVDDLQDNLKRSLGIDGGVMIMEVNPDSPAAEANLRRGDVLVQLGFKNIGNIQQYREVLESLPTGTPVPIRIYRQGRPAYSTIQIQ